MDSPPYKFSEETNINKHMFTHGGEKPFQCNYNNFSQETSVKMELLTHSSENNYSVQDLKTMNFRSLPLQKKIEIRDAGRPTPDLDLVQISKSNSKEFKRTFNRDIYEKNDWICGCSSTNRLFCFPCLLFGHGISENSWTKAGTADLSNLSRKMKKHEGSKSHINAQLDRKLLGKLDIRQQLDGTHRHAIQQHNEQVKQNRYVLSKIIDCIKFCGAFELVLHGHNNNELNPGIFKGLINFSSELDVALKEHLEKATVFKGTSKRIQNDLLDCMLKVYQENIKKEVSDAEFLSVIVSETSDISSMYQMAIVFRYVLPDGTPVERFWGFFNPTDDTAVSLSECIKNVLTEVLDKPEKLISQSYDGANVTSEHSASVQNIIQRDYKYAFYVHCYAHHLNLILAQTTSQNQEVRIFFSNLSDITEFFSNSPQRVAVLNEIASQRVTRASGIRWSFKNKAIAVVYEHRESLIECMEKLAATEKKTLTINQSTAICRMLQDPKFVFWLTVFHQLMPKADILYNHLEKVKTDPVEIQKAVKDFENFIQKKRNTISTIENQIMEVNHFSKKPNTEDPSKEILAAQEVCDTIITHVKDRFSFTNHLNASSLFVPKNFSQFANQFPFHYLDATVNAYSFLDKIKLQTELEIIYKRPDFRDLPGTVDLLKFIIENNLNNTFSASFRVLLLIITVPMMTTEAERCFSTLKRIKTFLRSTISEERLTALAMLSIEKKFIQDLPDFNEQVINKFAAERNRRIDLIPKSLLLKAL